MGSAYSSLNAANVQYQGHPRQVMPTPNGVATLQNGSQIQGTPQQSLQGDGGIGNSILQGAGAKNNYDLAGAKVGYQQYTDALTGLGQQSNTMANQNIAQAQALGAQNYMQGAQNAYGLQQENYGQQQQASQYLQNQATGNVASPADMQMQQGLANANNQAQSAAYSQQGGVSPGLTQRNLLNSQAQQNASVVNQGAQMRASETQAAQQNYATMLNNMGQTAGNMNQSQQNMGQFQYGQGQTALGQQNTFQQQNLGFQAGSATNAMNAANNIRNTAAGYNAQQSVDSMNLVGSAANAAASFTQSKK